MNKIIYLAVAIVIVALGFWYWSSLTPDTGDQGKTVTQEDSAASMTQDLDKITVDEASYQTIDADINSL